MYDVISKRIQTFSPRHKQFVNIYTPITAITILLFLRLFRSNEFLAKFFPLSSGCIPIGSKLARRASRTITVKTNSPRSNLARPEEIRCGKVLSSLETRLHSTSKFRAVSRRIPSTSVILMNFLLSLSSSLFSFLLTFSRMTPRFVPFVIKLIFRMRDELVQEYR